MSDVLQKICADKRAHVEAAKLLKPFEVVHKEALRADPTRGFERALRAASERKKAGFIAEIKKASPSAGLIRPRFSPAELARAYAEAGATCLSVLTDEPYFQGCNDDLKEAHEACELPILRKDFILDTWQIAESRAIGADCILLIMAALDDATASELYHAAFGYGMDVLVEVHDTEELARATKLPSPLIGVNSRNLKTMRVDLQNAARIVQTVPLERFTISESGIHTTDDIAMMKAAGARGFLVGESLLKHPNVGDALKSLMG